MISCNDNDGAFPLTKEECKLIYDLSNEKICSMETELNKSDPHKFYKISMIEAKMRAYITIMDSKKEELIERSN